MCVQDTSEGPAFTLGILALAGSVHSDIRPSAICLDNDDKSSDESGRLPVVKKKNHNNDNNNNNNNNNNNYNNYNNNNNNNNNLYSF